ncbi:hypothetical protein [Bacillus sp. AFS037270]|nr:hypothetical protein [Bacillus sp. AFS037270]
MEKIAVLTRCLADEISFTLIGLNSIASIFKWLAILYAREITVTI